MYSRLVATSLAGGYSILQIQQQRDTGIDGDPVLDLANPLGSNNVMWAHGKLIFLKFDFFLLSV